MSEPKLTVTLSDKGKAAGHVCECGDTQKWPPYVFAHWEEELSFPCPTCKKTILILAGFVRYKP